MRVRMRLSLLLGAACVASALGTSACGSTARGSDSDWSAEPETRTKRLRDTETLSAPPETLDKGPTAVLGVRHDLMLSATPHTARCNCLSVEVGRPGDPMFFWAGGAPDIPYDAVTIAVGARGIPCQGGDPDDRRRRPSISAVEQEGDDIFVEIEDLPEGRPLASGAIIPKPGPKGGVFVFPRKNNMLYGRNPGVGRCRVR
jgi:hypothetical protein